MSLNDLKHRLIFGDSRNLKEIVNEPVDLVVTSPPYYRLKDYGHKDQIGQENFIKYIDILVEIFDQCYELLNPGCRCCVVIGDSYISNINGYRVFPSHAELVTGCRNFGFLYMGSIIWRKISTTNSSGGGKWLGSTYFPKNGIVTYENEFIAIFKKLGKSRKPTQKEKDLSRLTKKERSEYFRGVWEIPGARQTTMAAFPLEIPTRLIKMFSFAGETVLDPFLGAGCTMQVCTNLKRRCIGVELVKDRCLPEIECKVGKDRLLPYETYLPSGSTT